MQGVIASLHAKDINQITQMTQSLRVHTLSTANTPDEDGLAFREAGLHDAFVEAHIPRVAGIAGAGSSRPVEDRHHITKRMARGKGRTRPCRVYKTLQLLERGEPPP